MKKDYCTQPQNDGDCETCSLSNFGRDCKNNLINHAEENERFFSALKEINAAIANFQKLNVQDWDTGTVFDYLEDEQDDYILDVLDGMETVVTQLKNILMQSGYNFPPFVHDHFEGILSNLKIRAVEFDGYVNGDWDKTQRPEDRLTSNEVVEYTEIAEKLTAIINIVQATAEAWQSLGLGPQPKIKTHRGNQ